MILNTTYFYYYNIYYNINTYLYNNIIPINETNIIIYILILFILYYQELILLYIYNIYIYIIILIIYIYINCTYIYILDNIINIIPIIIILIYLLFFIILIKMGELGIEPNTLVCKTNILPLNYTPIKSSINFTKYYI
jgi:hypothetical protein